MNNFFLLMHKSRNGNKYFANRQSKRFQDFYHYILEHGHRLCWIHDLRTHCYLHQLQSYTKLHWVFLSWILVGSLDCTYEYPMSHHWLSSWWNLCIDCIDLIHSSSVKHAPGMYVWWMITYGTLWLMYVTSVGGLACHSLRVTICKVNASGDAIIHAAEG